MTALYEKLREYGAPERDCIDLRVQTDTRLLRYADLIRDAQRPLVDGLVEQQSLALLYVIDQAGLGGRDRTGIGSLRRTLAMRGDPAWLGVLRPGRMDIYATDLEPDPDTAPKTYSLESGEAHAVLPRLAQGENLATPARLLLRDELLGLMTDAALELKGYGLSTDEVIALTGRALFFHYLIGRGIIGEGHRSAIAPSALSLRASFSTAASLAETNRWLDDTFNGDLLRLPDQDYRAYFARLIQDRGERVTRLLAAIMDLYKPVAPGLSQRRLARWGLDFNHLPIGLISETYERLMEQLDRDARRDTSVYYTPAHIADYMVQEALHEHPAGAASRVLDPACGAGVFLVACFRKLAEMRFQETGLRPTRDDLRGILNGTSLQGTKVWPNMNQPFCLLISDNRLPSEDDRFMLVSPEWESDLNDKGRMRIDACDAVPVSLDLVARQPAAIKTRYLGTALDVAVLERIQAKTPSTIADYWNKQRGLTSSQGFRVADRSGDDAFLRGFPTLEAGYSEHPFRVLGHALELYRARGLHRPRDPEIYKAPLLLIREGSRAERERGRALVSTVDVAYCESYYGYSAARHPEGEFLVRFLLVLVHSLLFEYVTLMSSGEFGIERRAFQLLDVAQFPLVVPESLDREQRRAIDACAEALLADDLAASRITVLDARQPCLLVGLLDRYRYRTQTQARLLASDLLWQYGAVLEGRAQL